MTRLMGLNMFFPSCFAILMVSLSVSGQNKTQPLPANNKSPLPAAKKNARPAPEGSGIVRQPSPQYCEVTSAEESRVGEATKFGALMPGNSKDRTTVSGGYAAVPAQTDWDFGDGTPHSSEQNPIHTYDSAGVYVWRVRMTEGAKRCQALWVIVVGGRPTDEVFRSAAAAFAHEALLGMNRELMAISGRFGSSFPETQFIEVATPKGTPSQPLRLRLGGKEQNSSDNKDCDTRGSDIGIVGSNGWNPPAGSSITVMRSGGAPRFYAGSTGGMFEFTPAMRLRSGEIPCWGKMSAAGRSVTFGDALAKVVVDGLSDKNPHIEFSTGSTAHLDGILYHYDGTSWTEATAGTALVSPALKAVGNQTALLALAQYHSDLNVRLAAMEYVGEAERAKIRELGDSGAAPQPGTPDSAPTVVGVADRLFDTSVGRNIWILIASGESYYLQLSEVQQATPQFLTVGQMYSFQLTPAGTNTVSGKLLKVFKVKTRTPTQVSPPVENFRRPAPVPVQTRK